MRLPPSPDPLEQLVACDDPAGLERKGVEKPELGRGQAGALTVDEGLNFGGVDAQLLELDRLAALLLLGPRPPACVGLHPGDELFHGERLDEVVVGADLERMHPVVLGAARRHDDDRRPDSLAAGVLDQLPAVGPREHQVDNADVRPLEAQPREAGGAVLDAYRVETGCREMVRHAVGDDGVVFDDQDLRHTRDR